MQFTIESAEGLPIRGNIEVPERARALVIIVHGFKGFKDWGFFPWLSERLTQHRLAACRFNMSRSGVGENADTFDRLDLFEHDTYSTQIADVQRVVQHCRGVSQIAELPIFLLGHSRGGGVALLAASRIERLAGVITWSSIARANRWDAAAREQWRSAGFREEANLRTRQIMRMSTRILDDYDANFAQLDIVDAASKLNVPLLVIHGNRDESVPVAESHELVAKVTDHSLAIIENAGHTYNAIHPLIHVPRALSMAAEISAHFAQMYA
jgi:pimeloyl-ACP methyl ester carboxylesterase